MAEATGGAATSSDSRSSVSSTVRLRNAQHAASAATSASSSAPAAGAGAKTRRVPPGVALRVRRWLSRRLCQRSARSAAAAALSEHARRGSRVGWVMLLASILQQTRSQGSRQSMSEQTQPLTIVEVARRAGVKASTVRYYESLGVLPEPERVAGQRSYTVDVLRRLAIVDVAQRAGCSLEEIAELFAAADAPAFEQLRALAERKPPEI